MKDQSKPQTELMAELAVLRRQVHQLEIQLTLATPISNPGQKQIPSPFSTPGQLLVRQENHNLLCALADHIPAHLYNKDVTSLKRAEAELHFSASFQKQLFWAKDWFTLF